MVTKREWVVAFGLFFLGFSSLLTAITDYRQTQALSMAADNVQYLHKRIVELERTVEKMRAAYALKWAEEHTEDLGL
jgi:hypothetical protein